MPESYLENALVKLARQLVAFDEASLMDLWEKYAEEVRLFEPTRRWEEAVLIFGLIQSVRMKNQLFNYNLSASRKPLVPFGGPDLLDLTAPQAGPQAPAERPQPRRGAPEPQKRGSVRQGKPKAGKLIPLRRGED